MFNTAYYQWPSILKLHAAVLAEIESGNMRWADEYSKLEQQMLMPFPVNRNKRNGNGDKGGLSKVASSSGTNGNGNRRAQRVETSQNEERVVYCGDYQHRNATTPVTTVVNSMDKMHNCNTSVLYVGNKTG